MFYACNNKCNSLFLSNAKRQRGRWVCVPETQCQRVCVTWEQSRLTSVRLAACPCATHRACVPRPASGCHTTPLCTSRPCPGDTDSARPCPGHKDSSSSCPGRTDTAMCHTASVSGPLAHRLHDFFSFSTERELHLLVQASTGLD